MARKTRRNSHARLFGFLGLLLLLASLLPFGGMVAGLLLGGGRLPDDRPQAVARGSAATMRVTVLRAEDQSPVEGARITVEGLTAGEADASSGPDGAALVEGLGPGPVRIEARVDGRSAAAWADPSIEQEIRLSIGETRQREGRILDVGDRPLRASVRLLSADGEILAEQVTGEEGRYALPDDPRAVAVCAQVADAAPAFGRDGDLVPADAEEVKGRLLGASGGALEVYARAALPGDDVIVPLRLRWPVGPDGSFSGLLPEGARAWARYRGLPLRLRTGELALPERVEVRGRVRCGDEPAPGARLAFRPLLEGDFPAPLPPTLAQADADGLFRVEDLPLTRYAVEVSAPGCATRLFAEVECGEEDLEFALERGFGLSGFVVDSGGLPVPDADVKALGLPEDRGERPLIQARTDHKGRFQLEGLGGTHARVRVDAGSFHPTTLEGIAPGSRLRVVLQRR